MLRGVAKKTKKKKRIETPNPALSDIFGTSLDTAGERNNELEDKWRELPRTQQRTITAEIQKQTCRGWDEKVWQTFERVSEEEG